MNNPFRPVMSLDFEHIEPLDAYSGDPDVVPRMMANIMELPGSMSTTLLSDEGKPIAIFVALPLYPKVWELCAYVDKSVEQCGHRYAKVTKLMLDTMFEVQPVDRVQITVRADLKWAARWASFLGLNFEGRLRKYGAEGVDHFLYAKVRE